MALEDIDDLVEKEAGESGHTDQHKKIVRGLKSVKQDVTGKNLVSIAERIRPPFNSTGNVPNAILSNGTNLGGTSRERVVIQCTSRGIVVELTNYTTAALPVDGLNSVTYEVSLQIDTASTIPFTFNGSRTVSIDPKIGKVRSDPMGITLNKGEVVYVRTNVSVTTGQKYPLLRASRSNPYLEGINVDPSLAGPGSNETGNGIVFTPVQGAGTSGIRLPGISALLGTPVKYSSALLAVGDSISVGTGESFCFNQAAGTSENLDMGWIARATRNRWPHLTLGISGTALGVWNTRAYSWRLKNFMETTYFTHILCELGINDLTGSAQTLDASKSRHILTWRDLAKYGKPVYQSTLTPYTSSTDNWGTTANQTVALANGNEAVRVGLNDWFRDGSPLNSSDFAPVATGSNAAGVIRAGNALHPLGNGDVYGKGYIEVADSLETSRNSGIYKVGPRARKITDAVIASGSLSTLSSATAAFTSEDVGTYITINGAGSSGATYSGYISAVTNATTATLFTPAVTAVAAAGASLGLKGLVADGIHMSGDYGTNKGGHQIMADFVLSQFQYLLGNESA